MNTRNQRAEETFARAREMADLAARRAYLDQVCSADAALRAEVESLLRAHEQAGDFLRPTVTLSEKPSADEKPGARIGRYKLLEQIGEGGFGVVWMAEQEEPVHRRVALKIIKLGMDTKEVVARFEAERQALAMMDHCNIASVFDGGATDTGRPYFVMELVKGVPITDYCDANKLPTHERLELFMQVCLAVQHAHQKGVIHRDLKPSNILVTVKDDRPVPKVIDFGVAKATQARLTEKTIFTFFQQWIGTPAYMSPEQAGLGSLDVDTRSDVYSLGVLLYELLTGRTPFDTQELLATGYDAVMRTIREEDPPKPSTRLSTLNEAELNRAAAQRGAQPEKLGRLVRGDLDWIAMKCLEKNRQRRYESADALAQDVARHLGSAPILARPPSLRYTLVKFSQRHRTGVGFASALALTIVIGLGFSTWQTVRATRAERTQSQLRRQAEEAGINESKQRQRADELRATAEEQARQIVHQLYASEMNLAFQAWERGDLLRVEQLLDAHRPKPGTADIRGFEWFYLWRLCHSAQLTLRGHSANVRAVAFSPDGKLLATAGDDSVARLWDANTGVELFALRGHSNGIATIAFTPDGRTLATGGGDQAIRLWNLAIREEVAVLRGYDQGVTALAFSPDGRRLAGATGNLASGADGNPSEKFLHLAPMSAEIKVWDVGDQQAVLTLAGHASGILSLSFSPDGNTLATSSVDGVVKLWNLRSGTLETNLALCNGPAVALAFSSDGQNLALGGGDPYRQRALLQVWDVARRKPKASFMATGGPVFALAFGPDGQTLATGGLDQIVRFWDIATGEETRNLKAHHASIWGIAYDPSGKRIATASWDRTVKVWDAKRPQGMKTYPNAGGYSGCFTPDGRYLIRGGTRLEIIDVGSDNAPFAVPDYQTGDVVLAIKPDGSLLASAGEDRLVTLWEVGTWKKLGQLRGHEDKVWQLAFSPDGLTLASSDSKVVLLWDVGQRARRMLLEPGTDGIGRLLFTPDGRLLIVSGGRRTVFLNTATGREAKALDKITWCPAITPDGKYLLGQSSAGFNLIDLQTLQPRWCIKPHRAYTWEVEFSPDGKTMATASWDGTAKLWNVASGQEMFTYKVPAVAWSTTFSRDGNWWVVGSGSGRQSEVALFSRASLAEVEAADRPSAPQSQQSKPAKQ